jgi:bifunctional non-homologous end joining protein LigD
MGKAPETARALRRRAEERGAFGSVEMACRLGLGATASHGRGPASVAGRADSWRKPKSGKPKLSLVELFAVIGADPECGAARSLRLARLNAPGELVSCGWVASGLSEREGRKIRAALDTGRPVLAEVKFHGFTPTGEPRHPVIKAWHAG